MFSHDLNRAVNAAVSLFPTFHNLSENRKAVLCNMAFNMGRGLSAFAIMLRAVNEERWNDAADAMLQSRWAGQVGDRAKRLAAAMRGET